MKEQINEQYVNQLKKFQSLWKSVFIARFPLIEHVKKLKKAFKEIDGVLFSYEHLNAKKQDKMSAWSDKDQHKFASFTHKLQKLFDLKTALSLRINILNSDLLQLDAAYRTEEHSECILSKLSQHQYSANKDDLLLNEAQELLKEFFPAMPLVEDKEALVFKEIISIMEEVDQKISPLIEGKDIKDNVLALFYYFQFEDFAMDQKRGSVLTIETIKKNKDRKFLFLEQKNCDGVRCYSLTQEAYIQYILKPLAEQIASMAMSELFIPENQFLDQRYMRKYIELHEQITSGFSSEVYFKTQIKKLIIDTEKLSELFKEHSFVKNQTHKFFSSEPQGIKNKYQGLNTTKEKIIEMLAEIRDTTIGLNDENLMLSTKNLRTF